MSIHYTIEPIQPAAHLFGVSVLVHSPDPQGQRVSLPNWIPGSYMIRDFARNVVQIDASAEGEAVALVQLDKNTWQAPAGLNSLELRYTVYAWDLSVRTAHLDETHGFFNGTSVFLCVEGQEHEQCQVTLLAPRDEALRDWAVATSLQNKKVDKKGFGQYTAQSYDELIDHPVEMGLFERVVFQACGVEHELVLTGKYITDTQRICQDLIKVCEWHIRFFGEPAPMDRYVFLVMVVGDGYGGLEHRSSTSLLIQREQLPVPGDETISEEYLEFLGLCSHEYFHTWNVKRIKPACFIPYELDSETSTPLLWAFEGITSYYDDLALVECGLIDRERYLTLVGRNITRVQRTAGRHKQSVAQSSFNAWTKFYKQDENAPNAIVSYYAKGAIVALCLDLILRYKSDGKKSLRNVMQKMWQNYLATGAGIDNDEIQSIASELCGEDLSAFFDQAVYGTEDLPLEQYFDEVGISLTWRTAEGQDDRGGVDATKDKPMLSLGARTFAIPRGMRLTQVYDGGAAQAAGLSAGDIMIALNELAVTSNSVERILARFSEGDQVSVHVFRRDELLHKQLTLLPPALDTCVLSINEHDARVDSWLPPDQTIHE